MASPTANDAETLSRLVDKYTSTYPYLLVVLSSAGAGRRRAAADRSLSFAAVTEHREEGIGMGAGGKGVGPIVPSPG